MNVPERNSIGNMIAPAAACAASSSFTKRAMIIPIPVKHIVPTNISSRITASGTTRMSYTSFATMRIKAAEMKTITDLYNIVAKIHSDFVRGVVASFFSTPLLRYWVIIPTVCSTPVVRTANPIIPGTKKSTYVNCAERTC
jgi:hypothetical protein